MTQPVTCPHCGKAYRPRPELSGRKVKCKDCQQTFDFTPTTTPTAPQPPTQTHPDPYALESPDEIIAQNQNITPTPAPPIAPIPEKCPNCNSPLTPRAVICLNCGYNHQLGKKIETQIDHDQVPTANNNDNNDNDNTTAACGFATPHPTQKPPPPPSAPPIATTPTTILPSLGSSPNLTTRPIEVIHQNHRRKDLIIPIWLLVAALVLLVLNALVIHPVIKPFSLLGGPATPYTPAQITTIRVGLLFKVGTIILIQSPFLIAGIFIVAHLFGTNFGNVFTGLLKLFALIVAVHAIHGTFNSFFLHLGMNIIYAGLLVTFLMYMLEFVFIAMPLFDMKYHEAVVLFLISFFAPFMLAFFVLLAIIA